MWNFTHRISEEQHKIGMLDWLLAGYIIMLPVQFNLGMSFRFAPADLFLLLYIFVGFRQLSVNKFILGKWQKGIIFIFLISSLVAVFKNGYLTKYALLQKDVGILLLFSAYITVTSFATNNERVRWLLRILIQSVIILNIISVLEFYAAYIFNFRLTFINIYENRLAGFLFDPNAYGGLLVTVFLIYMVSVEGKGSFYKGYLAKFAALSLAIGIILTFSRSAWLGLFLACIVILAYKPAKVVHIAAVFLLAFVVVLIAFGTDYLATMLNMSTRTHLSIDIRMIMIRNAIHLFGQNPIFGVGLGTFYLIYGSIIHSTYLWFLTEFGILGFTVFLGFVLWFIYWGVVTYKLNRPKEKPILIGLILAHVAMLGLSMGIEAFYQRHWWFIMALLSASYSIVLKDKSDYVNGKNTLSSGIENSA